MGGLEEFLRTIPDLRVRAKERKAVAEAGTVGDAVQTA